MTNIIALAEGTNLVGDYTVERVLGAGGFGITYLARESALDRLVTIKEYFPSDFAARKDGLEAVPRSQDSSGDYKWGLERFVAEAQTLARFKHPNIVGVHRYFRANNTAYMVLHYEEGQSLKSWLKSLGRVPRQADLDRVVAPLLDALEVIHAADFLHRDIAPDNVIINKDGIPILIDFGSARGEVARDSKTISALVKPGYSPYEQYAEKNSRQGPWTDIYALGATLYFAVTKKRPPDSILRVTKDEYRPVAELAMGSYRKRFLRAIDAALAVDIGSRPQSVGAWRGELLGPDKPRKSWLTGRAEPDPHAELLESGLDDEPDPVPGNTRPLNDVPPPPDAPGQRGGMLDFVDRLKKPAHRPLAAALRGEAPGDAAVKTNPNQRHGPEAAPQPVPPPQSEPEPLPATVKVEAPMPTPLFPKRRKPEPAPPQHHQQHPAGNARLDANPSGGKSDARAAKSKLRAEPEYRLPAILDQQRKPPQLPRDTIFRRVSRFVSNAAKLAALGLIVFGLFTYRDRLPAVDLTALNEFMDKFSGPSAATKAPVETAARLPARQPAREVPRTTASIEQPADSKTARRAAPIAVPRPDLRVATIDAHGGAIAAMAYSGDGSQIVTAGTDATLRIWTASTGGAVRIVNLDHGSPTSLAIHNRYAATGHQDGTTSVWDLEAGTKIADLRRNEAAVWSLTFTRSGRLAVASHDWTVSLWEVRKPDAPIHVFEGHDNPVQAVALSNDGNLLASGGADKQIRLWNLNTLDLMREYREQGDFVTAVGFSPDDSLIASGTLSGRIAIYRAKSRSQMRRLTGHDGEVTSLAFSPDGNLLVSASKDGTLRIRETKRWRTVKTLPDHQGAVTSIAFSPDSRTFASAGTDGKVRIWATGAFE
ncbi:MAG: serine/threonine protein kinase [Alphaproteobacteria bacterium]|nr:serine/threonine protein kinase [Alphaproteobacteria bacterium]